MLTFNSEQGLSPDLDWMMLSSQTGDVFLIRKIVEIYYLPLYQLAIFVFKNPAKAEKCVHRSIIRAVQNRHSYQPIMSVKVWLYYHIIFDVQRKSIKDHAFFTDLASFLNVSQGLSIEEIALVWQKDEQVVKDWLSAAHLIAGLNQKAPVNQELPSNEQSSASTENLSNPYTLSPMDLEEKIKQIQDSLSKQRGQKNREILIKEIFFGGSVVLLILALGLLYRKFIPDEGKAGSLRTILVTKIVYITATPGTPVLIAESNQPTSSTPLQVITAKSSPGEILELIASSPSLWKTLWADGIILHYGPPGYAGPPLSYRNRIWIGNLSNPFHGLVLGGPLDGKPELFHSMNNGSVYEIDLRTGLSYDYSTNYTPAPFLYDPTFLAYKLAAVSPYPQSGFPTEPLWSLLWDPGKIQWKLNVAGEDIVAGRKAVKVIWESDENQPRCILWVDALTGLILRLNQYNSTDPGALTEEFILKKIVYDADIPPDLFKIPQESLQGLEWDHYWQPVPDEKQASPASPTPAPGHQPYWPTPLMRDYDTSKSLLTFQWRDTSPITGTAELFADGYLMGEIEIGNPWTALCERSPDGRTLALINVPTGSDGAEGLRSISISEPEKSYPVLPNAAAFNNEFAFSPDSRYLAFWGCGGSETNCGIYIHDIKNRQNKKLYATSWAYGLTWNPDGSSLAFFHNAQKARYLVVVDVNSAVSLVMANVDGLNAGTIPSGTPYDWGVPFPPQNTGLEGCAFPPVTN